MPAEVPVFRLEFAFSPWWRAVIAAKLRPPVAGRGVPLVALYAVAPREQRQRSASAPRDAVA
jgi:hypothetical protein